MSTDVKAAAEAAAKESGAPATDELKNFKAEVGRKLDNTNTQLNALLAEMKKNTPTVSVKKQEQKTKKSFYEDEEGYMADIKEEVKKEMRQEIGQANSAQFKQQSIIASLVKEFPELNDGESDLAKKAVEVFNAMPDDERASPVAYKAAVKEAALDLDIKPKSKRKESSSEDDGFTLSSGRSGDRREQGTAKRLDSRTALFAEALGVDPAKVLSRINKRKSFTKWE